MAQFLKDTQLVASIEEIIENADEFLWLISPYIKLHERIKTLLKNLSNSKPDIEIIVIFGKNEDNVQKSISQEDILFLKELPNIFIGYEKRLHAKFYASEAFSIITSMNLHQFSHNNNIEAGIKLISRKWFKNDDGRVGEDTLDYFEEVINNCTPLYDKTAMGKSKMFGLRMEYSHSEVKLDDLNKFFKQSDFIPKQTYKRELKTFDKKFGEDGFCIRTGKSIPFNPSKPMCKEAYDSWARYKNFDFKENYCHKTGKPSGGKTSMGNPIL
jgi:hypothetical protein